jgi:hypothetical protein
MLIPPLREVYGVFLAGLRLICRWRWYLREEFGKCADADAVTGGWIIPSR